MFTNQILILCMQYHSFTRIWICIVFLFHPFKASFLSLQGQRHFFTITTVDDCLCHQTYWCPCCLRVWPLVQIAVTIGNSIPSLCIFTILRGSGWQRSTRRPPLIRMQNGPPFIINRSPPGGGSRGGAFHKCSDIYTPPPKTAPDQGMLNRYFPSQETPRRWRALIPKWAPLGGGDWGVVSWTSTLRHGDSNTPMKMTLYITCKISPTYAAPQ